MKHFDFISWILVAPIMPLFAVLEKSKGIPNLKANLVIGLYGYFVFCGALINLLIIVMAVWEVLL